MAAPTAPTLESPRTPVAPGPAPRSSRRPLPPFVPLTIAMVALVALLAALTWVAGLKPPGWLAAVAFAVAGWAVLAEALPRFGVRRFGPADIVTLTRSVLVGGVVALIADTSHPRGSVWPLVVIASVALAMDAVDGKVARRTGTASEFGARFDMEVDAFLILVLSAFAATQLGWWVLAIGAMRYLFVAAARLWPWLRAPLPVRMSSKAVAAAQGIVLTVALVLPHTVAVVLTAVALAALTWSFAHDIRWLHRHRDTAPAVKKTEAGDESPRRRRVLTTLGSLLVLFALLAPNELSALTPATFARIPVEGLAVAALVLVLPPRSRWVAAALTGVGLGVLTILKLFDMGFHETLARPFHPVYDWTFLGPAVDFLNDSVGWFGAVGAVIVAALLAAGLIVGMTLAALRLTRLAVGRRSTATRGVAVLGVVWVSLAVLGQPVAANSAANEVFDDLRQVRADLLDPGVFEQQVANDPFRYTAGANLLPELRGKDVLVTFVESYGRVAVEDPAVAPGVDAVLDRGTDQLRAAGFEARSAFMTSSTFGGGSWLAHASLQAGLWVDSQPRYDTLTSGDRLTLTGAFKRGGWRTVGVSPSITQDWPEAKFFGYDKAYVKDNVGYKGPNFSYAKVPDQYSMAALQRTELAPADRAPVMAEIDLVSSHIPWTHLPRMIDWNDIGDGSVYKPMPAQGKSQAEVWSDTGKVREAFGQSIQYSLNTLIGFLTTYGTDNTVMVFLGDHQPSPVVSGDNASHDVPITIVAKDPEVLDAVAGWGWEPGLNPTPDAPLWRMDQFRDRFLTTFGSRP
ncbi:CDP-alcohol phosphatidyltransferase family protein [Actinophytocola algeriensis]|uniref:Phosphatidylglycerophosphate synthase n=1 Tax=Actinophytocola algeriensis TaxID=1768010 RepID=A0A7W7Q1X8_9PSEU|nr:CDP-alcohol phosphatidyltransferase family protein [Actinophytocola algeriensis]MBB4905510.1 phosphatidylglycerophosphate synthase [Actinophytocola algeriensis]MBE1472805.1 phosphatidylglycerophosphate synthase [Actinophytocola algeriensis]